jgi:nicotinamide mononucleotide transporter
MITPVEVGANALNTLAIFLAGRNNVHTWWTGICGCLLFGWVFFHAKLYADVTLQVFFVATSIQGYLSWQQRGVAELPITRAPPVMLGKLTLAGGAVVLGYGLVLHTFTDAYAPFLDSAILAFSVLGQLLLVQRRVESWLCWLLVNSLAVPVYWWRGLQLTSLLYVVYWINALIALRKWRLLLS